MQYKANNTSTLMNYILFLWKMICKYVSCHVESRNQLFYLKLNLQQMIIGQMGCRKRHAGLKFSTLFQFNSQMIVIHFFPYYFALN